MKRYIHTAIHREGYTVSYLYTMVRFWHLRNCNQLSLYNMLTCLLFHRLSTAINPLKTKATSDFDTASIASSSSSSKAGQKRKASALDEIMQASG